MKNISGLTKELTFAPVLVYTAEKGHMPLNTFYKKTQRFFYYKNSRLLGGFVECYQLPQPTRIKIIARAKKVGVLPGASLASVLSMKPLKASPNKHQT